MSIECWLMLSVFILGLIALGGFFVTKAKGFGRFTTSTFLILIVFLIASLMFSAGKIDEKAISNLFFSVIGFAGGLFTAKANSNHEND